MRLKGVFLLPLLFFAASLASQAPPPTSLIAGHVYRLGDGVPLRRATVTLGGGPETLTALTDSEGVFRFPELKAGAYFLNCAKPGYISAGYADKKLPLGARPVAVAAGQERKSEDCFLIRGGLITGTVMDPEGEPLPGVQVSALAKNYQRGRVQLVIKSKTETDDRGQYRLFRLPPGHYYVQALYPSSGETETYAPLLYPNGTSVKEAQRIEVGANSEQSSVDIILRAVRSYSAGGRVWDALSGPAGSAMVALENTEVPGSMWMASTESNGRFRVRGLLPGRYRLTATVFGGGLPRQAVQYFDLSSSDLEALSVTVGRGVTLRGNVAGDLRTIRSAGLRFSVSWREGGSSYLPGGTALLGPTIAFEFPGLQPGDYELEIQGSSSSPGAPVYYVKEIRVGGQDTGGIISIREGLGAVFVQVLLDTGGGKVAGLVRNDDGAPEPGAQVVMVSADRDRRPLSRYTHAASADEHGMYSIDGIIPGDYVVLPWPFGADPFAAQDPDLFEQVERYGSRVHIEKAGVANQDLKLTAAAIKTVLSFLQ